MASDLIFVCRRIGVSAYRRIGGINKPEHLWLAIPLCLSRWGSKVPTSSVHTMKVPIFDPVFPFVRMPAATPSPQSLPNLSIDLGEDFFRDDVTMIVRPTSDQWVDQPNQTCLIYCTVAFYGCANFRHERLLILFRRLDQQLAVVLANVLP